MESNVHKRKRRPKRNQVEKVFDAFERKPTFETFYNMCNVIRKTDSYQCNDSLTDHAHEIPFAELKKIIEFLVTEGEKEKWEECDVGVSTIVEGHIVHGNFDEMSDERLELLLPYMEEDVWVTFVERSNLRPPSAMSLKEFRAVASALSLIKKEK